MTRRELFARLAVVSSPAAAACGAAELKETTKPYGFFEETFEGRRVYTRGEGRKENTQKRRIVVLLHELDGLSPGCADFGALLASRGYRVCMPLLFGRPLQPSIFGLLQGCSPFRGFHCNTAGAENSETKPVRWVRSFVSSLSTAEETGSVGVIGMCLTGAFGLATLDKNSKVRAVVMSQPALPFPTSRQHDVGISRAAMMRAKDSGVPILGLRFEQDQLSSHARMQYLEDWFGRKQFRYEELPTPNGFHETLTHKLHAVLTGTFGATRDQGREMVVQFLNANL